ncbi:alpha/beta hydrolase-fold protein [Embleya sp. NPDC020630]|uniref:alpha/beta hydrolase-fold protein n=1 Tax=Embleya sp. NPDC020630 TaxID=3363979 RepID=UPI00378B61AB
MTRTEPTAPAPTPGESPRMSLPANTGGVIETLSNVRSTHLDNVRDVHVYLPPGYDRQAGPYPVVWLHDGQHVFARTGLEPSWRVEETLDRLIAAGLLPPLIAVAVDNGRDDRGAEYSHYVPYPRDPRALSRGELYERFLIDELRPLIAAGYPITDDPAHTAVLGSSMGGLVSYHLAFRRPDVFGLAGVLSPFLVFVDPITLAETPVHHRQSARGPARIWIDIGGMEGLITVRHTRDLVDHLVSDLGYAPDREVRFHEDPQAPHHESAWARRVGSALLHLFGDADLPLVELTMPERPAVATGQADVSVAPVGVRADGCTYSVLDAALAWTPADALRPLGLARVTPGRPGPVALTATAGGHTAEGTLEVVEGGADALLEVTVTAAADLPADETVYYSGLVTTRVAAGIHHGTWRLPRGVGLNGAVGRGWRCDGLAEDGSPIRDPFHHDGDRRITVHVPAWTDPNAQTAPAADHAPETDATAPIEETP